MSSQSTLKVGVLFCSSVQLLDTAAVDLLAVISKGFYTELGDLVPKELFQKAPDFDFRYILDIGGGKEKLDQYISTTANVRIKPTDTLDTVGDLDYLLVPGPSPAYKTTPEVNAFLRHQHKVARNILVICTGSIPVAQSGIFDGKRVTAPLPVLDTLKRLVPSAEWTKKRWEVDAEGKIWTSGGVTNGMDMVLAFIRKTYGDEFARASASVTDITERGREYSKEQLEKSSWFWMVNA